MSTHQSLLSDPTLFRKTSELSFAYGGPLGDATFKLYPSDFVVEEQLHYELTEQGEHLYLFIEKHSINTHDVKLALSKFLSVPLKDIHEAGLKDKHAITRQWISVKWPIKSPVPEFDSFESFCVLKTQRHQKKLKRGAFGLNHFECTLRDIHALNSDVDAKLELVKQSGFPNYFGPQRFGTNQKNLFNALRLFDGIKLKRHTRSLALSSARSYLYNVMLSELLTQDGWPLKQAEYGALWGVTNKTVNPKIQELAQKLYSQYTQLCQGLENYGVEQSYRIFSVQPSDLNWHWLDNKTLKLKFSLPPGSFATVMLREMFNLKEISCES